MKPFNAEPPLYLIKGGPKATRPRTWINVLGLGRVYSAAEALARLRGTLKSRISLKQMPQ